MNSSNGNLRFGVAAVKMANAAVADPCPVENKPSTWTLYRTNADSFWPRGALIRFTAHVIGFQSPQRLFDLPLALSFPFLKLSAALSGRVVLLLHPSMFYT